ncbi:MAG: ribosome recycling factor [Erysipelotrichaceae bacterium]|nr:ribosome recycling factor [Erysipelotrichaceae bacterium]
METEIINELEAGLKKVLVSLEEKFKHINAGRANPSMLDGVMVNYYGSMTPLKSLTTISVPEARQLLIKPFDRSSLSAIEKAIFEANLGFTPTNDGETIRITIPMLTEDRRKELVKQAKTISEENKVSIRNQRRDAIELLKEAKLPEDTLKNAEERIQDLVNEYNKLVDNMLDNKTKDLMSV